MNDVLTTLYRSAIPLDVQEFAAEKGVSDYLDAVIGLARKAFLSSDLCVSVGQDAEDERHQYIALDFDAGDHTTKELLVGQRVWTTGIGHRCPAHCAVYFVLGWR